MAISSAGGVCFEVLDDRLVLRQRPGVFGEKGRRRSSKTSGRFQPRVIGHSKI